MSKRVLIFSLVYYPLVGGAEVAIKELTDRIPDIQFDMVTMRLDKSQHDVEMVGRVRVYRVGGGSSYLNKIFFVPRAAFKAWQLNRKEPYNRFWAMMTYMSFPIALMRLLGNKTPYALTLQDGDPFERVFRRPHILVLLPLLKYGFRNAKVIQPISNFLAKWPGKMGYKGRVEMVPNGVDVSLFAKKFSKHEVDDIRQKIGKKDGDIILASSSRLTAKNGLDDVVRALPLLPSNIKFFNWGVGPDRDKLLQLAEKLGVSNRVKLFPHDPKELPIDFHISDIFIRPSLSEGQGISFLEGMAASIPVIATPVGGIPDFLFDPDKNPAHPPTGLFVNVRDPKGIAKQVERLMQNTKLRETLVVNAKRMVKEKYDWDLIAETMKKRVFEA